MKTFAISAANSSINPFWSFGGWYTMSRIVGTTALTTTAKYSKVEKSPIKTLWQLRLLRYRNAIPPPFLFCLEQCKHFYSAGAVSISSLLPDALSQGSVRMIQARLFSQMRSLIRNFLLTRDLTLKRAIFRQHVVVFKSTLIPWSLTAF